ncbi:MAG: saccharopine dehydrogenase, partial [Myxococcota bacterium]
MSTHFWLRAESKKFERRCAIPPNSARALVEAGYRLTIEDDPDRIFPIDDYAGLPQAPAGSWRNAPADAVIVGLKELPNDGTALRHRHIYFAHAFKEQRGWRDVLGRFRAGDGSLFDLEFLTHPNGKRVAAFGYWAGYVGAVLGVWQWGAKSERESLKLEAPFSFADRIALESMAQRFPIPESAVVVGARGRSGRGAMDALESLGVKTRVGWDKRDTAEGGPFDALLDFDVFVNCVLLGAEIPPFVTEAQIASHPSRKLSVVSDVSCDPTSPWNPIPLYDAITTVEKPVTAGRGGIDVVAIDHLP